MIPVTPVVARPLSVTLPSITVAATQTALTAVAIPGTGSVLRVVNHGPNDVFIAVGNIAANVVATVPSSTAVSTCTPVLSGSDVMFSRDVLQEILISTICRSGATATLTITTCEGV